MRRFLLLVAGSLGAAPFAQGLTVLGVEGFYTDAPSYAPGDTIRVFGNFPGRTVTYRVMRIGGLSIPSGPNAATRLGGVAQYGGIGGVSSWEDPAGTGVLATSAARGYGPDELRPPYGSFVRFDEGPDLGGRERFTLEGWIRPTLTTQDDVNLAGQMVGGPGGVDGAAAIGLDAGGRLFGLLRTQHGRFVVTGAPVECEAWTFVALVYDGRRLRLHQAAEGRCLAQTVLAASGAVVSTGLEFRLGARAEAPGDRTGCFSGRLDEWSLWSVALRAGQLLERMEQGQGFSAHPLGSTSEARAALACRAEPVPRAGLELRLSFEEDYASLPFLQDGSGNGWRGRVVNHGTPGVSGRPSATGRALRLNHDQVIDARFDVANDGVTPIPPVEIPVGAWPSGLYAVQAGFGSGAGVDWSGRDPAHFQSLVVRPDPTATRRVAVLFSTNTWQAYNPWPGAMGVECTCTSVVAGKATAKYLTPRLDGNGRPMSGGNGSNYGTLGDGLSRGYYSGWRRPNLRASPIPKPGDAEPDWIVNKACATAVTLCEWLENPIGSERPGPIGYDAFAEVDLHEGTLDLTRYDLLVLGAKSEYWSGAMLDALNAFLWSGGSCLGFAGHAISARGELARAGTPDGGLVVEVRKWPLGVQPLGPADRHSSIAGEPMGIWRLLEMCGGSGGLAGGERDLALGTSGDAVGQANDLGDTDELGRWQPTLEGQGHWLWGPVAPSPATPLAVGHVVGGETDARVHYPDAGAPVPMPWNLVPSYAVPGSTVVLAEGVGFAPTSPLRKVDWDHPALDPSGLFCLLVNEPDPLALLPPWGPLFRTTSEPGTGEILYYEHLGGGAVLHFGSTDAARGMRNDPGKDPVLCDLAGRFLDRPRRARRALQRSR